MVPYSIQELYIAREQPQGSGALYSCYGRSLSQNGHETTTELFVSDEKWTKPKITIKNFVLRQVTSSIGLETASTSLSPSATAKTCAEMTWFPDPSFVTSNGDLVELVSSTSEKKSAVNFLDSVFLKKLDNVVLVLLFDEVQSNVDILLELKRRTYLPQRIISMAASEAALQVMRTTLGEPSERTSMVYKWMPEAELLQTLPSGAIDLVLALGVPDVAKNASVLATVAPLMCLTQADHQDQSFEVLGSYFAHITHEKTYILSSIGSRTASNELPESVVLLLPASLSNDLQTFTATLRNKLTSLGVSVSQTNLTLQGVASLGNKSVISLLEIDSPLVCCWDKDQFNAFKKLISSVGHLFWITHGGVIQSWPNGIEFATSQGLLRVMRNEYPAAILPSLDLSAVADISDAQYVDLVLSVWCKSLVEDAEMEYAEHKNLIYIARATEETTFDWVI
ncbi:hypothetical protein H9Q72_014135 [Fusarium xylarioides]|uniref:Polyketide synthase n=1 Tax=Fusarium xylarioides TaxID=221167 RepID=A0A9P7KUI9_9HYPO|nr:hypothetical protein H9Q72_014135 [Fusarium xylarioides]